MRRKKDSNASEKDPTRTSGDTTYTSKPGGTILFRNLPDDLPVFACTGHTDLRKSIAGLETILEEDYETTPHARCLTFFCGRSADRFKALMYDGDGYCLLTKYLSSGRFTWPQNGEEDGEMWWLDSQQFTDLMNGLPIDEEDDDGDDDIPEPSINMEKLTLFNHIMRNNAMPGGIYLCSGFTDLRKSVKGLSALVEEFGFDLQSDSSCFIFMGRKADRLKALFYDGDGLVIISKKIDSGKYIWPKDENELWKLAYSQAYDFLSGETLTKERALRILCKGTPKK